MDRVNSAVMKEHRSPAAEDEGPVHGTRLTVMRTKVSVLMLAECR